MGQHAAPKRPLNPTKPSRELSTQTFRRWFIKLARPNYSATPTSVNYTIFSFDFTSANVTNGYYAAWIEAREIQEILHRAVSESTLYT